MQVKIDMKCMQTNFGGCGYYGFGDFVFLLFAIEMAKFSLQTMEYM